MTAASEKARSTLFAKCGELVLMLFPESLVVEGVFELVAITAHPL
jgi:hypothetical protein